MPDESSHSSDSGTTAHGVGDAALAAQSVLAASANYAKKGRKIAAAV